eukprot:5361854-Prymnesium_polylepis.2
MPPRAQGPPEMLFVAFFERGFKNLLLKAMQERGNFWGGADAVPADRCGWARAGALLPKLAVERLMAEGLVVLDGALSAAEVRAAVRARRLSPFCSRAQKRRRLPPESMPRCRAHRAHASEAPPPPDPRARVIVAQRVEVQQLQLSGQLKPVEFQSPVRNDTIGWVDCGDGGGGGGLRAIGVAGRLLRALPAEVARHTG